MTTAEEVKRVREERGVDKAYGSDDVLYKLIELLIEEEEGA